MKILSWNVNGLRSTYRNGFLDWLKKETADVVCLQEIKAQKESLPKELVNINSYYTYLNPASKKGYAGVLIYTKEKPASICTRLGQDRFDMEGRMIHLSFDGLEMINFYLPHGGRQKENLDYKLESYRHLFDYLVKLKNKKILLIGDFNIAHKENDLARPKQNKDNIMFTPKEREQIDQLLALGYIDSFRKFHQDGGHYSWWPYMANARGRNIGWRIDYIFASNNIKEKILNGYIQPVVLGSDHCPIGLELGIV